MLVATQLNVRDMVSLGKSCWNLYCRLQPSILKYNIQHQNSNLLHLAARDNDYARAELMLLYGANANTFLRGKTPLMRAIQHGSIDVLEFLLSHQKIDLRIQNREGESVLTYAVKYGTCPGKGRLVKPQLDITIRDEHDRTAPPVATCTGHIGFLPWLWIPFNDLRVKGSRGYRLKDWVRRTKSQR
jgi:ankyrin repeat protein